MALPRLLDPPRYQFHTLRLLDHLILIFWKFVL